MNLDEFKQQNKAPSAPVQRSNSPQGPPRVPPPTTMSQAPIGGLPAGYLANGYFDEKGNVQPEVIIEWAKDIAQKLDQMGMKPSQLRKFFGEVRRIEDQLKAGKTFDSLRGRILKLDPFAADSLKKSKAPPLFKRFIEENIKWATKDQKSYIQGFVQHFESVEAYFPRNKD